MILEEHATTNKKSLKVINGSLRTKRLFSGRTTTQGKVLTFVNLVQFLVKEVLRSVSKLQ